MLMGHPKHENNSKSSEHFHLTQKDPPLQRELQTKLPPPKPPRPRTSKRKDGWGSESLDKSLEQDSRQLDLPSVDVFFDSLSLQYKKMGSEIK
jgi:hypothetical protein